MKVQDKIYEDLQISTYVINLPERTDRKKNIESQFQNRPEFLLKMVPAEVHKIGAFGLWLSIKKIIKYALTQTADDVILICEDDHVFTNSYNKNYFFKNIFKAAEYNTQIIFGGVGGVHNIVSITNHLYWVNMVWCTQFIVIYRDAFQIILDADFTEKDVADEFLCKLLPNKLVMWPFISIQQEFGYSDVTSNNAQKGTITSYFTEANRKFERYNAIINRLDKIKDEKMQNLKQTKKANN